MVTKYFKKRGLIVLGFTGAGIGMLMVGGSDMLPFIGDNKPWYVIAGLCLIGGIGGMISIPVLPEMMEVYESDEVLSIKYEKDEVENMVSGLFIAGTSLGEIIGPFMSSYLTKYYGFQTAYDVYALLVFGFVILYFLFCGACSMFVCVTPNQQPLEGGDFEVIDFADYNTGRSTKH